MFSEVLVKTIKTSHPCYVWRHKHCRLRNVDSMADHVSNKRTHYTSTCQNQTVSSSQSLLRVIKQPFGDGLLDSTNVSRLAIFESSSKTVFRPSSVITFLEVPATK